MSKPSKLKRVIKEMEGEIEEHYRDLNKTERIIDIKQVMLAKLKKIDGEKTNGKATSKDSYAK